MHACKTIDTMSWPYNNDQKHLCFKAQALWPPFHLLSGRNTITIDNTASAGSNSNGR